jgi:hypothetical protein
VTCAGTVVAARERSRAARQTITDPAHVTTAAALRSAYQARAAAVRGPAAAAGAVAGVRALSDYDEIFALTPAASPPATSPADLQVMR